MVARHEKTNTAVIQIGMIISFILNFYQKYKKSNRNHNILSQTFNFTLVKTQELTLNYLSIRPNSWHNKKSLAQIATPANIQNNYIKPSAFRLDATRLVHRRKFFNSENSFAVFHDQP